MMHDEKWLKNIYDGLSEAVRPEYAFISVKIKRFRTFNRLFGLKVGDELIEKVYGAIQSGLRPGEYAAQIRLNYFNMLVKLPRDYETIFQYIIALNRLIRDMPDERFHGKIFCGFGVYPLSDEPVDFYTAQYNADVCRYDSPERDFRNSHLEVYGISYHDPNLRYFDLRESIRPALEHGDFRLYLQPKVNLKTGEVDHAEALLRWIDPVRGMIPLGEFMQGLEDNGLIEEVDIFIFEEVCKAINRWIELYGKKIKISVNLSSCAFNYLYFFGDYENAYEKYRPPKDCIEIELVEGSILNKVERVKKVVGEIRDFGFSCALDDFGSGFSNFAVLSTEGFNTLKIDRSLFQDENNEREQLLVRHIISSAHELGMSVVAEGVERQGHLDFLKRAGCEYVQGFIFYQPMPVDEFERRFLRDGEQAQV